MVYFFLEVLTIDTPTACAYLIFCEFKVWSNWHIPVLNEALCDMEQVHSGICKLGQLLIHWKQQSCSKPLNNPEQQWYNNDIGKINGEFNAQTYQV